MFLKACRPGGFLASLAVMPYLSADDASYTNHCAYMGLCLHVGVCAFTNTQPSHRLVPALLATFNRIKIRHLKHGLCNTSPSKTTHPVATIIGLVHTIYLYIFAIKIHLTRHTLLST